MRETNLYHLLTEHPVIVFVVCGVLLAIVVMVATIKLLRRAERSPEDGESGENETKLK